jgi:hypothetical protein
MVRTDAECVTLPERDHRVIGFAKPRRALGDGVEAGLDIGR